ncbi:MAG: glycosyltransferase family 39 protein [Candidatus Margulisiibacteriota bacterium]
MNIYFILIGLSVFRFALALLFPLTADESYYWLWSKHLALSYVDHPPMVAYINYLMTQGTNSIFLLRLGTVIITFLISIIIYKFSEEIFNKKVAFWSAILFQILPHFLVIWLTMFVELPLGLFWALSIWILIKIIKSRDKRLWYLLAITVGLGYLSKYTMFLFWPCLAIYFFLSKEDRFWLKKKEPYLAFIISCLFFLPVLLWNNQYNWASFTFHSAKASTDSFGINFLPFVGDQLVHFTPFLIFTLFPVWIYSLRGKGQGVIGSKILVAFSSPLILLFLILSLKLKVWAHWPAIGYIAALPLTINFLIENKKSLRNFIVWISLFSFLALSILLFLTPGILFRQNDYAQNYKIGDKLPKEFTLFAKTNVSSSLLEFYSGRTVYMDTKLFKTGPMWGEKQYEIWEIHELIPGETIIYYGEFNAGQLQKAKELFLNVSEVTNAKLYLIEDYIQNNYRFYKLQGYKFSLGTP